MKQAQSDKISSEKSQKTKSKSKDRGESSKERGESSKERKKQKKQDKTDQNSPKIQKSEDQKIKKSRKNSTKSQKKIKDKQKINEQLEQIENKDIINDDQLKQSQISLKGQKDEILLIPFRKCVHHNLNIDLYCESCEEPICKQCTILGPHNNQLHRINRVEEAYRARVAKLSESIKNNLIQKRDQLLAQIHRIEYRIEEIKHVKQIIEKDAKADYGGILERLKSAEGIKIAVLQHEMSELQKDLDKINDIGHTFVEFTKETNDPIQFLLRSRSLYENIEFLVAKPFKINIDVFPYDLPRELTEMRLQLQKVNAQSTLIEYKNECIWKLIEQKYAMENQIKQQMEETAFQEIQEWSKLSEKFSNELKNYYLVCYYCNTQLVDSTVNKKCSQNAKSLDPEFKGYTEQIPDQKYNGNQRHFFAKPLKDYIDFIHNEKNRERQIASGDNKIKIFIEIELSKIKKICQEKEIKLKEIFQKHDKQKKGSINQIQFKYIITNIIGLQEQDADRLFKYFDQNKLNLIDYQSFLNVVEDPQQIDNYNDQSM